VCKALFFFFQLNSRRQQPPSKWAIIFYMLGKVTAVVGVVGMAALGSWLSNKRLRRGQARPFSNGLLDIDDDTAADIIRRVKPELHRVRKEQY
jgi:hypothetical protein